MVGPCSATTTQRNPVSDYAQGYLVHSPVRGCTVHYVGPRTNHSNACPPSKRQHAELARQQQHGLCVLCALTCSLLSAAAAASLLPEPLGLLLLLLLPPAPLTAACCCCCCCLAAAVAVTSATCAFKLSGSPHPSRNISNVPANTCNAYIPCDRVQSDR
jgi:hypothetical protein